MTMTKKIIKAVIKLKAEKLYVMTPADKASMALRPSLNGAVVIHT